MLLRQLVPTGGNAIFNGVDVVSGETNKLFLNLGYCPQHNALFDLLTGREVLDFFCSIRGIDDSCRASYVQRCLINSDLTEHGDKRCGKYSGGNKRKLSLAIAICGEPDLVVLDECSAGIDPAARRRLWGVVTGLLSRGKTVILTTHHMEEASHLGNRIGIMVDGRLACLGSSQHLKSKYGQGYELMIKMNSGLDVRDNGVLKLIREEICDSAVVLEKGGDGGYVRLGLGQPKFEGVGEFELQTAFNVLVKNKARFGIETFNLSQSGLEEVFLSITKTRAKRNVEED